MKRIAVFLGTLLLGTLVLGQEMHVRVGGAWEDVEEIHTRVSGTWEEVRQGWVRVSGAWEPFYYKLLYADLTIDMMGSLYGFQVAGYGASSSDLGPQTFIDNGGTTRTINYARWFVDASGSVSLALNGFSIPNSNTTFYGIEVNGLGVLTRSSAGYTANDGLASTVWSWSLDTTSYPTSGVIPLRVLDAAD